MKRTWALGWQAQAAVPCGAAWARSVLAEFSAVACGFAVFIQRKLAALKGSEQVQRFSHLRLGHTDFGAAQRNGQQGLNAHQIGIARFGGNASAAQEAAQEMRFGRLQVTLENNHFARVGRLCGLVCMSRIICPKWGRWGVVTGRCHGVAVVTRRLWAWALAQCLRRLSWYKETCGAHRPR